VFNPTHVFKYDQVQMMD